MNKIIYFDAIDKRTTSGKWIVKRVKEMSIKNMLHCSLINDIHPTLTTLRYKDLISFLTDFNLN